MERITFFANLCAVEEVVGYKICDSASWGVCRQLETVGDPVSSWGPCCHAVKDKGDIWGSWRQH
jgi:hypothetical protein